GEPAGEAAGEKDAEPADDPEAVQAVEAAGGKITRNDDGAIVEVAFNTPAVKEFDFAQLEKLPSLETLELWGAEIDNETLDKIKNLELRELALENTEITDEGLAKLAEIPSLRTLNLRRSSY